MGKKNSESSSKYREWERERRERLNVSFNDLGSLLPNHDPAISTSKVEILQKSAAYIRDLKKENSDLLLAGSNKIQSKKIKRFQRYVEVLLLRVQQMAKLLRDAGISLPPEPPSITPLGERTLRWSNKLTPKDAERALESEKSNTNTSQKKAKPSKKPVKKNVSASPEKKSSPAKGDSSSKSSVPSSTNKNSNAVDSTSAGNKAKSSPQRSDKEPVVNPVPSADRPPQDNGTSVPVRQLFSDTSHILTSLPSHVVGPDQQSGIIVIRTTGANTLGAVAQQAPQSTCFVIDNGNCGSVNSGQTNTIVASHPPTLESRPTFVLASNGSLLPVLPAPQFVTQPRQLIVSTSSQPVSAPKKTLAPISYKPNASNSQCIKPKNSALREVKCSPALNSDLSMLKKVPIPALPRNKQKPTPSSKDGTEAPGKSSTKKKCVGGNIEAAKGAKNTNIKIAEKKNVKLASENKPQDELAPASQALPQNNLAKSSDDLLHERHENNSSVNSKQLAGETATDSRKRELSETGGGDGTHPKRRKTENAVKDNETDLNTRGELKSTSNIMGGMNADGSIGNTENINNSSYISLTGSVSSYSIDALCKMNEKISASSSNESLKTVISPRKEDTQLNKINSDPKTGDQTVEKSCLSEKDLSKQSLVPESSSKSHASADAINIPPVDGDSVSHVGTKNSNPPNKDVNGDNNMPTATPAESSSVEVEKTNLVGNEPIIPSENSDFVASEVDALSKKAEDRSLSVDCENKGKADIQSSILPMFGSSPGFLNSSDDSYRKDGEGRESNCEPAPMDESSLPPGTFSSDLFASLQVPSGHSESISPTAAFLLAFPLVSTLTGKTPDLGSDNHPSQPLTSLDGGSGDNDLSSGGCGSSFLQLGALEENMPSSSSQSILSSLTTSNPVSSQSALLHLKSASTIQSLIPRSIEQDYDHETIHSSDMHLVERQVSPSKGNSTKGMVSKDVPLIPSSSKASSEVHSGGRSSASKETAVSVASIESSSMKVQTLKENGCERSSITNRNASVRESVNADNIPHSSQTQKSPSLDSSLVNIPTQNEGELINPAINKLNSNPCPNNPFEMNSRSATAKKSAVESRMFPTSDQQYVPYQLPNLACSSSDMSDPHSLNGGGPRNTGEVNTGRSLRQEMQAMDHAAVLLPQNQPSSTFSHVNHNYKTAESRLSMEAKQSQNEEHIYSSNNYPIINPPSSLPTAASSTSCFTISSFTSSFPSSASNSLLSSCTVTNSSPSFSSANVGPLLMTSSASTSSTTFPTHSNALYNNSSSSCIPPLYSNTLTPSMCTSTTTSFSNSTFTTVSESVITSVASSKTTASSKTSVSSNTAVSSTNVDSYGNHNSNTLANMLPVSFVSSASTVTYGSNPKMISQLGSSSHQQCSQLSKASGTVAEQKCHNHGHSNSMHPQMSESMKSNNIFSIDQLNNQNYCYNFNDYSSHVPSYMPQKPELEMVSKKLPNAPAETIAGNITSRMPGSFSVAHNSSNFSILSWTTLSPMSAAPSSSIDPQQNNMNGKADAYSAIHTTHLLPSSENGSSATEKVPDPNASSFPPSALAESREISSSYPQYAAGNNNGGMGTELNVLSGYPMPQDVGKQTVSRGHGSKARQQVTNWMTAPDPIHSSSDFSHNSDNINNDHVRDAFGSSSISYGSNSSFYGHSNQNNMPYASSNVSSGANAMLDRRNGVQSTTLGNNRNPQKTCSNMPESCPPLVANSLHLQPKPQERQQNQTVSCTYNKMANSTSNYIHNSPNDLPALPTLVGDLALGSCNSMKGFLPIYDENNSGIVKSGKQEMIKVQQSNVNSANCGNTMPHKESRDGRNASSSHEYGGSSFLSVSQLVDHVKDTSQQSQPRDNDRLGAEKVRSKDANKSVQASRRNVSCQSRRQSHVKRDAVVSAKEQHDSAQIYNSQIPPQGAQTFTNQGITPSVVSSNPTHLHAPPIPFPPYKSVHWPVNDMTKVTDNSRNTANYKSSSSYSAEALIRPCLSTAALDSRLSDIDMSSYGMDIHKFPLPSGRSDHLFAEFVESNAIGGSVENVCQQQHHPKQNNSDHRQSNENFRPTDQSNCDKFNYPSNAAPSTFHSHHHHHPHIPPSFGNNEDYSVETGNPASSLGLSTNGMEYAPFPHSKETGTIPSSISNACAPIGYSAPPNSTGGAIQNQSQQCRVQEGKASMRSAGRNCDKVCNASSSAMQVVSSKLDGVGEGNSKQVAKEMGVNHSSRSIPPFLSMDSNASSYLGHHYHSHNHHNHTPHYSGGHPMGATAIPPLNESEHQSAKLFPCFPPPASGMNHLPHQSVQANPSMGSGNASGNNLSSGTLTNFNLSTIFPEINDKQTHHSQMASSTSSFETSSKNSKLCTVTSSAPILHPPSPLPTSYHHYRPHQHNHQPFAPPVDLGNRLPPPHPPSSVLHSNVSFNNLMVQSSPQVNGIGINAPLQPPPPPFSTPSFGNVLPGI